MAKKKKLQKETPEKFIKDKKQAEPEKMVTQADPETHTDKSPKKHDDEDGW